MDAIADSEWYGRSLDYWDKMEPSISGVLAGFEELHPIDLEGSEKFLNQVYSPSLLGGIASVLHAADCGAGVGRVSEFLLSKRFSKLDLIEPCKNLLDQAKQNLTTNLPASQVGSFINEPLQTWIPAVQYDAFWHQWVLMYLKDADCISYLERCRKSLRPNGVILVKENVLVKEFAAQVDNEDNSVTRTLDQYLNIFRRAGLRVALQTRQHRWPAGLYPVIMFALVDA